MFYIYALDFKEQTDKNRSIVISNYRQSSGDISGSYTVDLQSNLKQYTFAFGLKDPVSSGGALGGKFSINFTSYSGVTDVTSPGTAPSNSDIQSGIASTTSQIASSVNDVYDSIHDLMQHISNQLAALWDQIYNYCHVPTYNKLQEILLSIQNISMGSDLQKIADQISTPLLNRPMTLLATQTVIRKRRIRRSRNMETSLLRGLSLSLSLRMSISSHGLTGCIRSSMTGLVF